MSKYHNKRTIVDNVSFASRAEAQRYQELKILVRSGAIQALVLHPVFTLQEKFTDRSGIRHRAILYVGDFGYIDSETGCHIVEDVKGKATAVFLLKQKLFIKRYPNVELRVLQA